MRVKGWSRRSGLAKVDIYTRGTVYFLLWSSVFVLFMTELVRDVRGGPLVLAVAAPLLTAVNGVLCHRFTRQAMNTYLGLGAIDRRTVVLAGAATAASTACLLVLAGSVDLTGMVPMMLSSAVMPFVCGHCLLVRGRISVLHQAVTLAVLGALLALTGRGSLEVVVGALTTGMLTGWLALTVRISLWVLNVMLELRTARDTQARLAVAEERLRFGRDMHDVLGRNLAVIALKSELAVQLARRGRPEAVDQMTEVQRIAQESQREVRDVVRGYREADLRVELEGARGVLDAAGIDCAVDAQNPELPPGILSTLGWVVRETTTNVLRHGDAKRCTISLAEEAGGVRLTVENDGVRGSRMGRGSGLAGLRERLAAVGGTLEAAPGPDGTFRVTARIPHPTARDVPARIPHPTDPDVPARIPHPTDPDVPARIPHPTDPDVPARIPHPTDSARIPRPDRPADLEETE
ncbi:histidine kinase [Streptomyces purpureus]|uniref:sensor histidine kinase n=1 Tax=Streptomyces purpureus TaxID=1951 RepID=UPI0027E58F97|nr:histidine kinase [Streptomyces purpureus]